MKEKKQAKKDIEKKDKKDWFMIVINLIMALATVTLAIFTFLSVQTTKDTVKIMQDESILMNRPYVFADMTQEANKRLLDLGISSIKNIDPNTVKLTFLLKNNGPVAAKKLTMHMRGFLANSTNLEQDITNFKNNQTDKKNELISVDKQVDDSYSYSLFPEQEFVYSPSQVGVENLVKRFIDGEDLVIELRLEYEGISLENSIKDYSTTHILVYSANPALTMFIRETQDN